MVVWGQQASPHFLSLLRTPPVASPHTIPSGRSPPSSEPDLPIARQSRRQQAIARRCLSVTKDPPILLALLPLSIPIVYPPSASRRRESTTPLQYGPVLDYRVDLY